MCRLLGIVANKPVDLQFSLERFKQFTVGNPDGWGIGWYKDSRAIVFKQGLTATSPSSQFNKLSKDVKSKIIVAHIRKGTNGEPSERNSHPFSSMNWLFAHNGSVDRGLLLGLLSPHMKKAIRGETDSEPFFYHILQSIEECNGVVEGITKAVKTAVSGNHAGLNFLLSDGQSMFALRYANGSRSYYSLYHTKRDPSCHDPLELRSRETGALLRTKSLRGESAVLVCSEKLTDEEDWKGVGWGNLLCIGPGLETEEIGIL